MRTLLFVAIGVVFLGLCGYLYWITTPYYAIQEAGFAAAKHDLPEFEKHFDVDSFVDNLIDDLLVKPAATTPGLSTLQRETGRELIGFAKASLHDQLVNKIRTSIGQNNSQEGKYSSFRPIPLEENFLHPQNYGPDAAIAGNENRATDVQGLLRAAGSELGSEARRLKNSSYIRFVQCARQQPKTLCGKLLGSPPQVMGFQAKLLVDEYGLTKDNFRGLGDFSTKTDSNGNQRAIAGLKFFSPRANREIVLQLGMYQNTVFGGWKIFRLENLRELMLSENEDYEYQVHSLMACALSGVTEESIHDEVRGLTDRIKQRVDTKSILRNLKMRFR